IGHMEHDILSTSQLSPIWFFIAGGVTAVGALFGSAPLFGLGLLLGAAILTAWSWSRICLINLKVERQLTQTRAFWGEEIEMLQVFTNNKALPVPWLAVEDLYPGRLEITSTSHEIMITPGERQLSTDLR